jgi:nitroreductase
MGMKRVLFFSLRAMILVLALGVVLGPAQDLKLITLPAPQTDGGRPLMQVLKDRKSTREFGSEKLPLQVLSNLLWAAFGVNRPSGQRTAPSAVNWQEIDIYVALADGLFLYDAKGNALQQILAEDIRAAAGIQPFVKDAPVNLIYVADYDKPGRVSEGDKDFYSAANVGFIAQNAYLYCASEGLVVVVRAMIDRPALAKVMKLRPRQRILLAQTVGYPKK